MRGEPDTCRAKADAESMARKGGGESGISDRSGNFRIFLIRNPLPQAAPKSSSRATLYCSLTQRTVGGAQLAQDCLDLDPIADAAADHLHDGAV